MIIYSDCDRRTSFGSLIIKVKVKLKKYECTIITCCRRTDRNELLVLLGICLIFQCTCPYKITYLPFRQCITDGQEQDPTSFDYFERMFCKLTQHLLICSLAKPVTGRTTKQFTSVNASKKFIEKMMEVSQPFTVSLCQQWNLFSINTHFPTFTLSLSVNHAVFQVQTTHQSRIAQYSAELS